MNKYRKNLHCIPMAESIEKSAAENLSAWAMLGQSCKYVESIQRANILRHAETMRTITERREYLNAHGIYF